MERIKELRKEKSITMKRLGEIIGVSEGAVSQYENGKRQPDYDTLKKIADFFDVSTDYLLGRTDNPQQNIDQQLEGIEFALYGEIKELTDDEKQDILNFVKFTKSQRKDWQIQGGI